MLDRRDLGGRDRPKAGRHVVLHSREIARTRSRQQRLDRAQRIFQTAQQDLKVPPLVVVHRDAVERIVHPESCA